MGAGPLSERDQKKVIIGIVVALPEELATLATVFPGAGKIKKGDGQFVSERTLIAHSGVGPDNARLAAQWLGDSGADCLVSWGCAAGLDRSLKPGDLVVSDTVVSGAATADFDGMLAPMPWCGAVVKTLSAHLPIRCGAIVESKKIVASSLDKSALHLKTGAIALDMESGAVAKEARARGLPFLAIRAIADPAAMALPLAVSNALDERGRVAKLRLLKDLASAPGQLPDLIKLGLYFKAATKTLRQAAAHITLFPGIAQPVN